MKKIKIKKYHLFIAIAVITTSIFLVIPTKTERASASSLCPSNYSQQACYNYLLKLKQELAAKKKKLNGSINAIKGEAGDIQGKVNTINAEIQANENELAQKEIDIELFSIDIANVGADIVDTQDRVDTLKQEKTSSLQKINEVAMLSFKLKTIPTWYLLTQNDLISTLEMLKYYDYVADQEQVRLAKYTNLQVQLDSEEQVLADAQAEIIKKRNDMEAENHEIVLIKDKLTAQRAEQTKLLAALKIEEKKLAAERAALTAKSNAASAESMAIAMQLFSSGRLGAGTPVQKGGIVGFQGHTGCAYGSHLHFGIIRSTNKRQYRANVNPFTSGYLRTSGGYVQSGSGQVFYSGALITQWYHDGYYIDTISVSEGNQSGSRYYIKKGTLKCNIYHSGWHNQRGEGAPVRALFDGVVYRGTIDRYGGNFVVVDHGNNLRTAYYHLR